MPLDQNFFKTAQSLLVPGMGTEHVGLLLYSFIRATRPRNVLEVGMGYTTPFLAMALHDNVLEAKADTSILNKNRIESSDDEMERREVLNNFFFFEESKPMLHAVDDFSMKDGSSKSVLQALEDLGLGSFVTVYDCDYRGSSKKINKSCLPIDFIWFDCGDHRDYRNFIAEYWNLINPHRGLLLLHFTYTMMPAQIAGGEGLSLSPGPILNELKRQQASLGMDANFEVLSVLEPHKSRQGSVTIVRKLPPEEKIRRTPYDLEVEEHFKHSAEIFPDL